MSFRVHSEIDSVCLSVCTTIFKRIAGLRFYPKSLMSYINEFVSMSSRNKWKAFFKFQFFFLNFGWKPKNIQTNKVWISIKFQCVIYKSIRLDKLYKLRESFFQVSESFFELATFLKIIVALLSCMRGGGGICAEQHAF